MKKIYAAIHADHIEFIHSKRSKLYEQSLSLSVKRKKGSDRSPSRVLRRKHPLRLPSRLSDRAELRRGHHRWASSPCGAEL